MLMTELHKARELVGLEADMHALYVLCMLASELHKPNKHVGVGVDMQELRACMHFDSNF